jgi:aldose 1-epimerase
VTETGATLRVYDVGDVGVIDGFGEKDICPAGRGQVLAPWPNRLGDGRYSIDGRNAQAALDEPERMCAIHGLVRWLPWRLVSRAQNVLVLDCVLTPQPGYPWRLGFSVEYRLGRRGLVVSTEVENLDQHAAPFGLGFHPYIKCTTSIDEAVLRVPAKKHLLQDERGIPNGETLVTGSDFDFGDARPVGSIRLDTAFTDLVRDADQLARVEMDDPKAGCGATVWMDSGFRYVMIYTADTVDPVSRRRKSIAVEPMTCPPDALRSGVDLIRIEPGGTWRGRWGITPGAFGTSRTDGA